MHARVKTPALSVVALIAVFAVVSCNKKPAGEDQKTGDVTSEDVKAAREGWPEEASKELDAANESYRQKDYKAALEHYENMLKGNESNRDIAVTGYFGIYMTQTALGDSTAASAAQAKLQSLAPDASLLQHGAMTDSLKRTAPQTPQDSVHAGLKK